MKKKYLIFMLVLLTSSIAVCKIKLSKPDWSLLCKYYYYDRFSNYTQKHDPRIGIGASFPIYEKIVWIDSDLLYSFRNTFERNYDYQGYTKDSIGVYEYHSFGKGSSQRIILGICPSFHILHLIISFGKQFEFSYEKSNGQTEITYLTGNGQSKIQSRNTIGLNFDQNNVVLNVGYDFGKIIIGITSLNGQQCLGGYISYTFKKN
jgi:hypothetical protein